MDDAKAWQLEYEKTWAKAHAIVAKYPHLDPSGVYHALCNLLEEALRAREAEEG